MEQLFAFLEGLYASSVTLVPLLAYKHIQRNGVLTPFRILSLLPLLPLLFTLILLALVYPIPSYAHPVISEVMWMGSPVSTADEWLEITSTSESDIDLSGFSVTSRNSAGVDVVIARFLSGSILGAGESIVIANQAAAASLLLYEPFFVSSSMTLPNTKLLLRLIDAAGNILDEVDDGVGAPFAGANPSGGIKASMERISLEVEGNSLANWKTSSVSQGFDTSGAFGTPGFFEKFSSIQDDPETTVDASTLCTPFSVRIHVQDGEPEAYDKTTLNLQAVSESGSVSNLTCMWDYGDGYTSTSCNPPPHLFDIPGAYSINLEAKKQCGNTVEQVLSVHVKDSKGTEELPTQLQDPHASLLLSSALPNPIGQDTGREYIEIRNLEERSVRLDGWTIGAGKTSIRRTKLTGSIAAKETIRVYALEALFQLSNSESQITLFDPRGSERSKITWKKAEEGREYYSADIAESSVWGYVERVLPDGELLLKVEGEANKFLEEVTIVVRLIGVTFAESEQKFKSIEFLRALIEKKKIELEFDTEIWDADGRMLAYVFSDTGILLQHHLLSLGFARTHSLEGLQRKQELLEAESKAKNESRGLWKFNAAHQSSVAPALPSHTTKILDEYHTPTYSDIVISEIYANPQGALKEDEKLMSYEWLELLNTSDIPITISEGIIEIGKKKKILSFLTIPARGFALINASDLGLKIPDAGALVLLRSSDGFQLTQLHYPKLKKGLSYGLSEDRSYCIGKPSPKYSHHCDALPQKKIHPLTIKYHQRISGFASSYRAEIQNSYEEISLSSPLNSSRLFLIFGSFIIGVTVTVAFLFGVRSLTGKQ